MIKKVGTLFPLFDLKIIDFKEKPFSKIGIFSIKKNNIRWKLFVKHYPESNADDKVRPEYIHQKHFFKNIVDKSIVKCPRVIMFNESENLLIMEYVEGENFKKILLRVKPIEKNTLNHYIDLSGIALAKFHRIFEIEFSNNIFGDARYYDSPLLRKKLVVSQFDINKCGLNNISTSFIDFAPWNTIFNDGKIYLTDFPASFCIATPHLDLARFKYTLKVLNEYPRFKILNLNWWNPDQIFSRFLKKYADKLDKEINDIDIKLINRLEKEYAIKEKQKYDSKTMSIMNLFEKWYMTPFLENLIHK